MYRTHLIQLEPTNKQRTHFQKAAGVSRFAYNWALARWQEQYHAFTLGERDTKPSQHSLRKELNSIKREQFPWMMEVTKCAPQEAIINLGKAFEAFWAKRFRYPQFKKRGTHDTFTLSSGTFEVVGDRVRVSKIGWIQMHESFRYPDAKLVNVTISRKADRWYAAITVEVEPEPREVPQHTIGIDVGVNEYVTSDGDRYPVPRTHRAAERSLRRAQQALSRKQKGSANRRKAAMRVAKIHRRTATARQDWLQKLTTQIANGANVITIEDLNVAGMTRNRSLAKSITDAAFGQFRRQLEYKTAERGTNLVAVYRFYPSSKTCSACGTKTKSLKLSQRIWTCDVCGVKHDRDLNAAINLSRIGMLP